MINRSIAYVHVGMKSKTELSKDILYSIMAGVVGSMLLVVFLSALMSLGTVVKFIPWIIGFNSALTGYTLMDRTGRDLNRKRVIAAASGFLNAVITYIALSVFFFYLTGSYLYPLAYLLLFVLIGSVLSWIGALLAIKYLNLA